MTLLPPSSSFICRLRTILSFCAAPLLVLSLPTLALPGDTDVRPRVEEPGCFRVSIDPPIRWISSLTPRPGPAPGQEGDAPNGGWVLADSGDGLLRLLDADGRAVAEVVQPGKGPLEFNKPTTVEVVGDRLLLQDGTDHLLLLDRDGAPLRDLGVTQPAESDAPRVAAMMKVDPVDAHRAYAFGTLLQPDGSWWTGFYRLEAGKGGTGARVDPLLPIPMEHREGAFYTLLYPLVAAAPDGRGYLVRMTEEPHVLEAAPGRPLRRLEAFPEGFARRPALPELRIETVPLVGHAIAGSRMVAGIEAWEGRLWMLTREPADGGTRWRLHGIDPQRDRITRTVTLPTRAPDLSFAPGPHHWAFLEKRTMQALGEQPVDGLLLVPSAWIVGGGPDAPPLDGPLQDGSLPDCPRR